MTRADTAGSGDARVVGVAVGIASFLLYFATLHPSLPGGDSGEFIAVAHELGIAHPPGYPLYTVLGHVWIVLLSFADPAWAMNLLSALTQATACGVLTTATARATKDATAGVMGGAVWAVTAPVWKMAVVAEVFALNALFAAVLFAAFLSLARGGGRWAYTVICLLCGALIAHHHTLVLLAAPVFVASVVVLQGRLPARELVARAFGAGLLGASPILLLPLVARTNPALAWGDPSSWSGLLHHLLRGDYGTLSLEPEESGLTADVSHVALWLRSIPTAIGIPAALLALVGLGTSMVRARRDTHHRAIGGVVLGFFALQVLFFTRVGFPDEPLFVGVVERFWILPSMVVAWLAALGLQRIAVRRPRWIAPAIAAVVIAWPAISHVRTVDASGNVFFDDHVANVLASNPEGGALFVQGDVLHNALAVATVVRGLRPDLAWADQELMTYAWGVDRIRSRAPGLLPEPLGRDEVYDVEDPTSWNVHWFDHLRDRPVAVIGVKESSYAERYAMVPRGLVSSVVPIDEVPTLDAQAETAIALFDSMRWRSWFRRHDPRGFEAHERWRLADFVTRTCLLACQPAASGWTTSSHPGLVDLEAFLEMVLDHDPGFAELDRAGGLVSALHPAVRDVVRARRLLDRSLRRQGEGARADEARRVLRSLPSVEASR